MRNTITIALLLILGLSSCKDDRNTIAENKAKIFSELYNQENIKSEYFNIDARTDTTLITKNGSKYRIYANSFELEQNDSTQIIQIEIKEAINPIDFIIGNLTTISNDKILSSDGMLFIGASINDSLINLKDGKEIGIMFPTSKLDEEMLIFEGIKDSTSINWINQKDILNQELKELEESYKTITIQFDYYYDPENDEFNDWLWKAERKIGDTYKSEFGNIEIIAISRDTVKLRENEKGLFIPEVITKKGENGFVEDFNTSYIFSVKKLGWANIDKFFNDPESKIVDLSLKVKNEDFSYVFTSLLLPNKNMYIPGYERMDGSFGFTHNDAEDLILPIGDIAYIMATSYIDDLPYFDLIEFEIRSKKEITLELKQTTAEELKNKLAEKIKQ
ncbi:hypothetical protein [Algibacter sp. 2305UL17-15]|uniref:hypothetical protein n=1 Tax=Algibacter sp. 2305UL17-15 TaxID=3231268 RepID=UPI0034585099